MPIMSGRRERDVELQPAGLDLLRRGPRRRPRPRRRGAPPGPSRPGRRRRRGRPCRCRAAGRPCRGPSGRRGGGRPRGGCGPRPTVEVDGRGLLDAAHRLGRRVGPGRGRRASRPRWYFLPCCAMCRFLVLAAGVPASPVRGVVRPAGSRPRPAALALGRGLADDLDAHAARRALDLPHGGVEVVGVEVGHLDASAISRSWSRVTRPDGLPAGGGGALVDAGGLAQQVRGRAAS